MRGMVIDMEEARLQTVAQVRAFLEGTTDVSLRIRKAERYGFIERTLKRLGYARHSRADKGVLLRYLERMTGLSRQQVTRLMRQYRKHGSCRGGAVRPRTALPAATPLWTWPCWPRWMRCTARCPAPPPRS